MHRTLTVFFPLTPILVNSSFNNYSHMQMKASTTEKAQASYFISSFLTSNGRALSKTSCRSAAENSGAFPSSLPISFLFSLLFLALFFCFKSHLPHRPGSLVRGKAKPRGSWGCKRHPEPLWAVCCQRGWEATSNTSKTNSSLKPRQCH